MNVALWIVAGILAAGLLASGTMKLVRSREQLAASGMGWAKDFSDGTVKTIGVLEVLAAVGLILPAVLDILPIFVPLAATGAALVMIGAVITHIRRNEMALIGAPVVILAMAIFEAWGRFGPHSFTG